jgi:DNA-binding SARP family transcriptional activator
MLTIHLFGAPELLRDGAALQITRRKSRALVFYLAAQSGPVRRAQLLELLWPDHERGAAQQLLRTTLHGLRRELGDDLIASDSTLAIAPSATVDARQLENALRQAAEPDLQQALAGYRGPFLAGFTLPDNPEFDDWAAAERERYSRLALRGWELLAQHHRVGGDWARALDPLV